MHVIPSAFVLSENNKSTLRKADIKSLCAYDMYAARELFNYMRLNRNNNITRTEMKCIWFTFEFR